MKKVVFKILVIALVISALLGITIIILDLWNEVTAKVLATTAIIFGFSIPGLCCSTIYEKENKKYFSIVGMLVCFISCLYMILLIWEIISFDFFDDINWKIIESAILLSSSFGHISLLLLIDAKTRTVKYLKNITIGLSALIDILILLEINFKIETSWQLLAVLAILIVLGTIITPIINKLSNNPAKNNKYTELEQLKKLLDNNAITEVEYEIEKSKILNK